MSNKNLMAEVLAPAGSYDIFRAVVNAGADAVYLGGTQFGARAYSQIPPSAISGIVKSCASFSNIGKHGISVPLVSGV